MRWWKVTWWCVNWHKKTSDIRQSKLSIFNPAATIFGDIHSQNLWIPLDPSHQLCHCGPGEPRTLLRLKSCSATSFRPTSTLWNSSTTGRSWSWGDAALDKRVMIWVCLRMGHTLYPQNANLKGCFRWLTKGFRDTQFSDKSILSGWWFGTFFIFPYLGNSDPNWLIFFRGVQTTNQICYDQIFLWRLWAKFIRSVRLVVGVRRHCIELT
jgi:hypothetical protein